MITSNHPSQAAPSLRLPRLGHQARVLSSSPPLPLIADPEAVLELFFTRSRAPRHLARSVNSPASPRVATMRDKDSAVSVTAPRYTSFVPVALISRAPRSYHARLPLRSERHAPTIPHQACCMRSCSNRLCQPRIELGPCRCSRRRADSVVHDPRSIVHGPRLAVHCPRRYQDELRRTERG